MIRRFYCVVTRKITIYIPQIWSPLASPSFCVAVASGEPLEIFKIPYVRQSTQGGNEITDGLVNNYIVVSEITVAFDISYIGF